MAKGVTFNVNDKNWKTFVGRVTNGGSYGKELLRTWAKIYLADQQRKYVKNSRGGGQWPAIKKSTAKAKGNNLILVETGKLRNALQLGGAGNFVEFIMSQMSVQVGFSDAKHDKKLSYNKLARIHQNGEGNNPVREILEPPSPQALKQMIRATQIAMKRMEAGLK